MWFSHDRAALTSSAIFRELVVQLVGSTTRYAPSSVRMRDDSGKLPSKQMFMPILSPPRSWTAKGRSPGSVKRSAPRHGRWSLRYEATNPAGPTRAQELNSLLPADSRSPKTAHRPNFEHAL